MRRASVSSREARSSRFPPSQATGRLAKHHVSALVAVDAATVANGALEVAPGQHEMSPIFCVAAASCDSNVLFMEARPGAPPYAYLAVLAAVDHTYTPQQAAYIAKWFRKLFFSHIHTSSHVRAHHY